MHAAPPVAVRCTAAWVWRALQTALPALAAAVSVFWSLALAAPDLAPAWQASATLTAALVAAVLAWRASAWPARWLDWDGQRWSLDGRPGELQLMIDIGQALLLRHGRRHWLVATRGQAGAAWHALRVAVRSPATKAVRGSGPDA